jgi:hypothetical protein
MWHRKWGYRIRALIVIAISISAVMFTIKHQLKNLFIGTATASLFCLMTYNILIHFRRSIDFKSLSKTHNIDENTSMGLEEQKGILQFTERVLLYRYITILVTLGAPFLGFTLFCQLVAFSYIVESGWLKVKQVCLLLYSYQSSGLIFIPFVLLVAIGLFKLRKKIRWLYGLGELTVSIIISYNICCNERLDFIFKPQILLGLLTASIYLTVRALDNMEQGGFWNVLQAIKKTYTNRIAQTNSTNRG